jgi:hypothetical protein
MKSETVRLIINFVCYLGEMQEGPGGLLPDGPPSLDCIEDQICFRAGKNNTSITRIYWKWINSKLKNPKNQNKTQHTINEYSSIS